MKVSSNSVLSGGSARVSVHAIPYYILRNPRVSVKLVVDLASARHPSLPSTLHLGMASAQSLSGWTGSLDYPILTRGIRSDRGGLSVSSSAISSLPLLPAEPSSGDGGLTSDGPAFNALSSCVNRQDSCSQCDEPEAPKTSPSERILLGRAS